jgi:hypothetical protein
MKTTITRTWTAARRLALRFQIRSLEITIDGQTEALECIGDRLLLARIQIARHQSRGELAKARAEYNATLPPGQRVTWRMA